MIYTIDPSVDEPIMLLDKHIGYDEEDGQGIDGALFQRELMMLDSMGKKRIQVWINCPGGSVYEGYSICNAILKSNTPVDTYNFGIAASMGGVAFMCGRKRSMADYALFMIHNPSGGTDKKVMDVMADSLATVLAAKSKINDDDVRYLMDRTSWLTASDCYEKGFATEIEVTADSNRKRMPASDAKAMWREGKAIINSILNNEKNTDMALQKLTMKLGLNEAATEDNILAEVKKIEDRAYTAETNIIQLEEKSKKEIREVKDKAKTDVDAAKADVETAKAEVETVKNNLKTIQDSLTAKEKDFTELKNKFDAMEKEKNDAIEAEKKTKSKTMVAAHVKTGRIKNDAKIIERWENMAMTDFDGTEELIKEIPLNSKAPVLTEATPNDVAAGMETSAMALAVRNKLKREGKAVKI